jgi:protein-tyrosine-phosphatase
LEFAMSIAHEAKTSKSRPWWIMGGMLGLAFGYFLWYTPYAGLTKALSSGLLPGMDKQVGGLVLLPSAAIGTLIGAPLFLAATGWWRYIGTRRVLGRMRRFPSRTMLIAGFFMSLVIATTTLNYTFAGVSILFMLLMMRGGILVLSPIVDTIRGRRVRVYSWLALGFSLLAVFTALIDVKSYTLTAGALASLLFYYSGYIGRFQIMSKVAKTGDEQIDRRYFAEEAISAAVWQVVLCAVLAVLGLGQVSGALREGFTSFLFSQGALAGLGVGLLYSALYVYGTLIYLDPREYTWCVPANRCSSLLSGLVASFVLTWLTGIALPGKGQFIATAFIFCAIAALSYPAVRALVTGKGAAKRPLLLFVCSGNTCRSAMAEAVARATLSTGDFADKWRVASAGTNATPGTPMPAKAVNALRDVGIAAVEHSSRLLTAAMITEADTVFCMTGDNCDAVLRLAPEAADKVFRFDPNGDIPDPHGQPDEAYRDCADRIREVFTERLAGAGSGSLSTTR